MKNLLKDFKQEDYTITKIIDEITKHTKKWIFKDKAACPWYRRQSSEHNPLPRLFRDNIDEFHLNTTFRNRASALKEVPETNRIDKWLFLMQHYGAPTRLLDWTENLINALFFALDGYNDLCECKKIKNIEEKNNPTIWALNSYELNEVSNIKGFPNTWISNKKGSKYFQMAWTPKSEWDPLFNSSELMYFPIAVHTNFLDMRIFQQQSCFTIRGTDNKDFVTQFENTQLVHNNYFLKFIIPKEYAEKLYKEIIFLGVRKTNVFPDLSNFALDLKQRFTD